MNNLPTTRSPASLKRRTTFLSAFALAAAVLMPPLAAAGAMVQARQVDEVAVEGITFKNQALNMAGNVYLPTGRNKREKYPAIVVVHPGGGVKEQAAGLYAKSLAQQGFIALTFDAPHQGASGGLPRFLEDPTKRVEDVRSAVDYLTTLAYVDASRIGALGICAGGGHAIKATTGERRIKSVATVSAVVIGAATRKGWDGKATVVDQIAMLDSVAKQRTAEAAGATALYVTYVPTTPDRSTPADLREASEYYLTARGQHQHAPNKMLFTSLDKMASFTALDQVDSMLAQPAWFIAGSAAGSLWHRQDAYQKTKGDKAFVIVDGATHMTLYDGKEHVAAAMGKLTPVFQRTL